MTETGAIAVTPEVEEATQGAIEMAGAYKRLEVTTQEAYTATGVELKHIKSRAKELDALRRSMTKPLDDSKARIMGLFRPALDALKTAETDVKKAMLTYEDEQEAKRKAEEDRLREVQRKETERLGRLGREAAERARVAAEAGDAAKAAKDAAKAEAFAERAETATAAPVTVAPLHSNIEGVSRTKRWTFEIENASLIPRPYLMPNEKMLGEIARSTKGTLSIPGVRIYSEDSLASRS